MAKLKLDSDSVNFDLFFKKQIEGVDFNTESGLPKEILFKLDRNDGVAIRSNSTSKMSGLEKMYVLWKSLNKKIFIVIEDEEEGVGFEEYVNIRNSLKKNPPIPRVEENGALNIPVTFIKSNKELSEIFSYYNYYCNSPAYKYAIGIKNQKPSKLALWKKEMTYLSRLILNYESCKERASTNLGLTLSEVCILMYLYDNEEKMISPLYKEKMYMVRGASKRKLVLSVTKMIQKGLITKKGITSTSRFKITPLGADLINEYFKKYVLNL